MKKNIGTFDRVLRVIVGLVLIIAIFFVSSIIGKVILGAFGIFSLYEALVGWCAFYAFIGRRTCPIE